MKLNPRWPEVAYLGEPMNAIPELSLQPMVYKPLGKDAMTRERWKRIKALQPRATMMFKSCQPRKETSARATYRKAEHGAAKYNP